MVEIKFKVLLLKLKFLFVKLIHFRGKHSFILSIPKNGKVLDVGCGNNSPQKIKSVRPDVFYVGVDIGLYNQNTRPDKFADKIILTDAENFHKKIEEYSNEFDSLICAHNLEHCNDYLAVTRAMNKALKIGGKMYISFPSVRSQNLPSRNGTLNFYDDNTHVNLISYNSFISFLKDNNLSIEFSTQNSTPLIPFVLGLLLEPLSRIFNQNIPFCTWALYGFETIIICKKKI